MRSALTTSESVAAARYPAQPAGQHGFDLLLVHAYELPKIHIPAEPAILDACPRFGFNLWPISRHSSSWGSNMRSAIHIEIFGAEIA